MCRLAVTLSLMAASLLPAQAVAMRADDAQAVFAHPADAAAIKAALAPVVMLAAAPVISGSYTQDKFLHALPKPLRASGDFLLVRNLGIAWRMVLPFPSELIITRDALIERQAGGSTTRIATDQRPTIRQVGRILLAVLSLDFDQLDPLFTLSLINTSGPGWQLGLQPKQAGAAGVIRAIVVSGHHQIERVHVFEADGERVEIELHDTQVSNVPADTAQRARFAMGH